MALVEPDPDALVTLSRGLYIVDKVRGGVIPWVPTTTQARVWRLLRSFKRLILGKPRQVYVSTATALYNSVWSALNDREGNMVKTDVVLDTDNKAIEMLDAYESFLDQIKYPHKRKARRILLRRGSRIDAIPAGGNRIGASKGVTRIHASELPYWGNNAGAIWAGLHPSVADEGYITAETTFNVTNQLGRELWYGAPDNGLTKAFLRVEDEERYVADPESISDERFEELRREGYTSRPHAAFFDMKVRELVSEEHAFREYPQTEEHMFRLAKGRFIKTTPAVTRPLYTERIGNEVISVYQERQPYGEYVIGVDTSEAIGRDASCAVCIDKRSSQIVALFYSADAEQDILGRAAVWMQKTYTIHTEGFIDLLDLSERDTVPPILVEKNGPGIGTYQIITRIGGVVSKWTTDEGKKITGLLAVKQAIEQGLIFGPIELANECESLHRDHNGKFKGAKDLLMSLGFCLLYALDSTGQKPTAVRSEFETVSYSDILSRRRKGW